MKPTTYSLPAEDRLKALEEIAAEGLREDDAAHVRERGPNPGQLIGEASADGHRVLAAMGKIAKGGR
jgi:hypothetical protein